MASKYLWQAEVSHDGLNKYKVIKAQTRRELQQKVAVQEAQWNEQWNQKQKRELAQRERELAKLEREAEKLDIAESVSLAEELTEEAQKIQDAMETLLIDSLTPITFDFSMLKDKSKFSIPRPTEPIPKEYPREPLVSDVEYNTKASLFTKFSKKRTDEHNQANLQAFQNAHSNWERTVAEIQKDNDSAYRKYETQVLAWQNEADEFYNKREEKNQEYDILKSELTEGIPSAIETYFSYLLSRGNIPFEFDKDFDFEYHSENKHLIVDMLFPRIEDLPTLKNVSFVKSRKEFKKSFFSDAQMKKKYDNLMFNLVLQTLNYIFSDDITNKFVDSVTLNGKINTIDKATGKAITPYLLSVSVNRDSFDDICLETVDPKVWFKNTKGVSAATFANITPVAPIVQMQKNDARFIDGYSVVDTIDDTMNLATMDWQDFENLIRELFEQEFNSNGGEVKITQASRDGGVDAVAFDPDPIRGGKIVIQAKRYTNVVGVSAVRDLYGTVMNEGANKGILVTTSNYGNDAYEFAKGKPLTLLNGGNLLHLLEKHGHKAKINLKEAKEFFSNIK